jgi:hypothetical protein
VIRLDLDTPYDVKSVEPATGCCYKFERKEGKIWIHFPMTKQAGEEFTTVIKYSGTPRVAPKPPWIGGFMWEKTPSGADWISVALQNDGADLMFPCKDHPSDKPAMAAMHITVPDPLIASGPGKLEGVKKNSDGTSTYNWRMTNPIANYSIVFNAAPYKIVEDKYKSIDGTTIPIFFYVIPEDESKAAGLIAEQKKYLAYYEKYLGPVSVPIAEGRHRRDPASRDGAFDRHRVRKQIQIRRRRNRLAAASRVRPRVLGESCDGERLARLLDPRGISVVHGQPVSGIPPRKRCVLHGDEESQERASETSRP